MIKNDLDNIEVPENIDDTIDLAIDKIRNSNKKKRKIAGTIAAGLALSLTIGLSNPVIAENIPILKDVFKLVENNHLKKIDEPNSYYSNILNNDYSKYSNYIGESQESNGVKITIQETVYDGENLYMSYKVESEKAFGYKTTSEPINFDIDPVEGTAIINKDTEYEIKDINSMLLQHNNTVDYSKEKIASHDENKDVLEGIIVDDNTFIGVARYGLPRLEDGSKPKNFKASININEVSLPYKVLTYNNENIEGNQKYKMQGNWNFDIDIKLDESIIEVIEVNEVKDGFKLESITKTPFNINAKIIPLKEENQKNIPGYGDKVSQLQQARIIGSDKKEYGYGQPSNYEGFILGNYDEPGTIHVGMERSKSDKAEYFQIQVEDNTI
ncbi:MAG: DUF4179 domain-containing protein, partial [Clostridium sp.]